MKNHVPLSLQANRIREGQMGSDESYGMAGAFRLIGPKSSLLLAVSSGVDEKHGWEHVSVSTQGRPPNWEEMCFVKDLFWGDQECVVQFHPPKSEYVNCHPYCLHLWRMIGGAFPMPPSLLVGPKRRP
jgi:hypothetical protein